MKKLLFVVLILTSFGVYGEEVTCENLRTSNASQEQLARRGCCSHHGGVCGCQGGRTVCCDGSYSPSCGCHNEDSDEIKSLDINKPIS
jgi:hypothetical protein